ncbi:MAG: protein kinase [bacterium]|nr:protein kinase [bacterium]
MRVAVKLLLIGFGGLALLGGGVALAVALFPEQALVSWFQERLMDLALERSFRAGPADLPERVEGLLENAGVRYGLAPLGLVLFVAGLIAGRAKVPLSEDEVGEEAPREVVAPVEKKTQKKVCRQAVALARAGRHFEAAELCFQHYLNDEAAGYFIEAGELIRAAEIRHDQNRFLECSDLYLQAGSYDSAGAILCQEEEWVRAADAYVAGGNHSVAAEMFEKAGDWRRAAECYEECDFSRHAAKAWVRCHEWLRAATSLETVIAELQMNAGFGDEKSRAELRKLVRMAGDLYQRADRDLKAQKVLERGECWAAAGEIALRCGREAAAADLFLRAHDAPRAAEVLKALGRDVDARRVLAEYHRDRGEEAEAAQAFADAGEHMAAGDLYRMLNRFEEAGECYEMQGEYAQAAEMFGGAGNRERAAENYERGGAHAEAAEWWALVGDGEREAGCLVKAGEYLRAGALHREAGRDDEAITALQQLGPDHADFPRASAILGEIFRGRGQHSLALKKLTYAVGDARLDRDNVQAFFGLAAVHESTEDYREALESFEKILAFDYNYPDVAKRVADCKEKVQAQMDCEEAKRSPLSGSLQQGRYRIVGKLGRGGMGIVYKAKDTVLDRVVAFKVLPDTLNENPKALKNFLREAKSAAQLNHQNIVTIYDAGEQDAVYYIAMEYVDGNTLKEIVKARGKISCSGTVHVLGQMCEALSYAHEQKIVHRDIKTANTMWTRDRKAKIMDFGLAKVIEEVRNHTTVVSGTPYYMSPEQTLGKNVDHRTDIYSLGVTIFELATGILPFREGNLPYHHVHTPAPDPREINPEVSPTLQRIILRCLQKAPDARYGSAREILAELRAAPKT